MFLFFQGGVYAVEAKGGTGKTFCISTLISTIRGLGKIVLAMAVSANAATLFAGGRTAHSKLKIPIELDDDSKRCNFKEKSVTAKLIKEASLLIIGEKYDVLFFPSWYQTCENYCDDNDECE